MKEADLFRQYAKEAMRWSSLPRSTAQMMKSALINLAAGCTIALMTEGIVLGSASFRRRVAQR